MGEGDQPETFFFGISDFATVKVAEDREERGLPAWANEEVQWEVPCELLLPLAHPLGLGGAQKLLGQGGLGGREGAGYAKVEYICAHLGTMFEGVPGCTEMPPVHFWVSPPKRETKLSVRRDGNRGVAQCALLLARIVAHWIKGGHYVPLEDLPGVGAGVEFMTVAEMWGDVAMLAAWGGGMARRPGQRPSGKLGAVCDEVTAMVEARTDEPPLVTLSWVGYLALALAGEESLRVPFGCVVPYSGGTFWGNPKVRVRGEMGEG